LYDLALGSGQYIMTSPLFNKMQVKRDNGNQLTVIANDNNKTNKYIRSATLDGKSLNDVYINQNQLLNGNHTLSFNMSSVPTS
jgi:putative alpha-1,2-mannosidase